jgi:pimeloyl-ACP methyl ester carboxylesterase
MRTLIEKAVPGVRSELMIALLPGSYSEPEDFIRQGFPAAVREHGIAAELVLAEARATWFADGSIVERLHREVVAPARARGHSRIWLAGISLGALAALCYAARRGDELEGVVLISPYPATREVLREVAAAGDLSHWKPAIPPEGDLEREAWLWLASRPAAGASHPPIVHCYFGSEDRFAAGQRMMARTLDPASVAEMPGGHDWPAWKRYWDEFLERSRATLA